MPYVPPAEYSSSELRMQVPRRIKLSPVWLFGREGYENLRMGHQAQGVSDLWNCWLDPDTNMFHAHREPTGYEIYRMPLEESGGAYIAPELMVEQDLARNASMSERHPDRPADDGVVTSFFSLLLSQVMQAPPTRLT